ncbi:MAG: M57 family metalloprotease [Methanosarcinales archaeon]|jgi:hypothetical protein|nr:M57 family metalloprotease [Methanosarcinales archaeon]
MKNVKFKILIFCLIVCFILFFINPSLGANPGKDKWFSQHIPVEVAYTTLPSDWRTSTQNAMNTWSNAGANFGFKTYAGSYYYVNVIRSQVSDPNTLAYESGTTGILYSGGKLQKTGSIIRINTNISWSTNNSSRTHDVESVILHELGHSLCLGHVNSTTPVMYGELGQNQLKRTLTQDDKNGVKQIYG